MPHIHKDDPFVTNLSSEDGKRSIDQLFSFLGFGEGLISNIALKRNIVDLDIENTTGQVEEGDTSDFLKKIVGENNPIVVFADKKNPKLAVVCVQSTDLELREQLKTKGRVYISDVMPPIEDIDKEWFLIALVSVGIKKLPGLFRLRPGLDLERIGIHLSEEDSDRYKRSKSGLNLGSIKSY